MTSLIDLSDFGYAPGRYLIQSCRDCKEALWHVEKRSWRCEPCAILARDQHEAIIDCPLICDMPHL